MSLYGASDVFFPNLGIDIHGLPMGIEIFGFKIAFYGMFIALAMFSGYLVVTRQVKKTGQKMDNMLDYGFIAIVLSVIGARCYYVIFHWESFADTPLQVFNLRTGGLAIYGGVIVAVTTAFVFCKIRKLNFGSFADTAVCGLILGQALGRWGNFCNKEVFGKFTNNLFAMQLDIRAVGGDYLLSEAQLNVKYADNPNLLHNLLEQLNNATVIEGITYIQCHPTFFYEMLWHFGMFAILMVYSKHRKFNGELLMWYLVFEGIGRFWIEGIRTDQLYLWNTAIPVSQLISAVMFAVGVAVLVPNYARVFKTKGASRELPTTTEKKEELAEASKQNQSV